MYGKDYFQSDLFAVGCVFWQLYFGKFAPWSRDDYLVQKSSSKKALYHAMVSRINGARRYYLKKLQSHIATTHTSPLRNGFLRIILQMTNPYPKKRGTAENIYSQLSTLMNDYVS